MAEGLKEEPEQLTLDVDATEIEAEKQEAAWTYNHAKGYLPMLGYVNGLCVGHEFREGKASPGAGILEFAERCEGALPEGKRIDFRSDSAAYRAKVINHYSQPGRRFTITADWDAAVKREIGHLPETAWQPYRTATVATLRWKLYRLAAKLVRHARGWVLQIKADLEKWRLLESARLACARLGG